VHFTSASDASDSDGEEEEEDDRSDASADDKPTTKNPTSSPPGYIFTNICIFISLIEICD
jgi:N-lysine methyltransferase SETD6